MNVYECHGENIFMRLNTGDGCQGKYTFNSTYLILALKPLVRLEMLSLFAKTKGLASSRHFGSRIYYTTRIGCK